MSTGVLSGITPPSSYATAGDRLHKTTDPGMITVDPRARQVIKATTGITLSPTGTMEVVDNPTGQMPPWDVIASINDAFVNAPQGSDVSPATVATEMAKYKDHFTPLASYDPSTLVGVWDLYKAKDSTVDLRA